MAHDRIAPVAHTIGFESTSAGSAMREAGGAEPHARLQAEEQVRRGDVVTVVCPSSAGVSSGCVGGVFVRRLRWVHRRWYLRTWTYLPMLAAFLVLRVRRYDLVHLHLADLQSDVAALVAALLHRAVYVKVAGGGGGRESRRLRPMACLTRYAVVLIPNGLDTARFLDRTEEDQATHAWRCDCQLTPAPCSTRAVRSAQGRARPAGHPG